jgi:putative ABC transport system permease protein
MARPGTALISALTARDLGIERGDSLTLRVASIRRAVRIVGLMEPSDALSARALADLLVTDIATAQELLGVPGRLSRIDLIIGADAAGQALLDKIARALPPGADLAPAGARAEATVQMTRAFSLNLSALSLLALVVGMFLIYNTMTFSVVERRPLIGTLRALGVTRREIFTLVILAEAAVMGLAATAVGLGLGVGLAHAMLGCGAHDQRPLRHRRHHRGGDPPAEPCRAAALGLGARSWPRWRRGSRPPRRRRARCSTARSSNRARGAHRASPWPSGPARLAGALLVPPRAPSPSPTRRSSPSSSAPHCSRRWPPSGS